MAQFETLPRAATLIDRARDLPANIASNVSQLVARLVAGSFGLPISWTHQTLRGLEASRSGFVRSDDMQSLTHAVVEDPMIVDRAIWSLLGESLRKQTNRERVARNYLELLETGVGHGALGTVHQLDPDWFNRLFRYVEDASSERLQRLWSEILFRESLRSSRFSLKALSVVANSDEELFRTFAKFSQTLVFDFAIAGTTDLQGEELERIESLERWGLIIGLSSNRHKILPLNMEKPVYIVDGDHALALKGRSELAVNTHLLTPLGRQLITLVPKRDVSAAMRAMSLSLSKSPVTEICLLKIEPSETSYTVKSSETLWSAARPAVAPKLNYKLSSGNYIGSRSV